MARWRSDCRNLLVLGRKACSAVCLTGKDTSVVRPMLQALLLADHVYQDKDSGKKVIAGTFNVLNLFKPKPPSEDSDRPAEGPRQVSVKEIMKAGSPSAFISLTEIREPTDLELRYVDLSNNAVLIGAKFRVTCHDPLATVEAIVLLPPLPAPHSGVYALE